MINFVDNFRKAWYQQVDIEKSTTETELEDYEVLRPKKVNKMSGLKNKSLFDVSDESDGNCDGNCFNFQ